MSEEIIQETEVGSPSSHLISITEELFTAFCSANQKSAQAAWAVLEDRCDTIVNIPSSSKNARGKILLEYLFHYFL